MLSATEIPTSQIARTTTATTTIAQISNVDAVVRTASTIAGLPTSAIHPPTYPAATRLPLRGLPAYRSARLFRQRAAGAPKLQECVVPVRAAVKPAIVP